MQMSNNGRTELPTSSELSDVRQPGRHLIRVTKTSFYWSNAGQSIELNELLALSADSRIKHVRIAIVIMCILLAGRKIVFRKNVELKNLHSKVVRLPSEGTIP